MVKTKNRLINQWVRKFAGLSAALCARLAHTPTRNYQWLTSRCRGVFWPMRMQIFRNKYSDIRGSIFQSPLRKLHHCSLYTMTMAKLVFILLLLLCTTESNCKALQFSQSLYDIFVDHEPTDSSEVIGHVNIKDFDTTRDVCYWTNANGSLREVIKIDASTGDVRLLHPVNLDPKSFEMRVHVSASGCYNQSEDEAEIRVHVTCVMSSRLWDGVWQCRNAYAPCATTMCTFALRPVEVNSRVPIEDTVSQIQAIQLIYRIEFRHYGCLRRVLVSCTSSKNALLQNMIVTGIGADMKCPRRRKQPANTSSEHGSIEINLDDLCALGGAQSWIDIGFAAVLSTVTDEAVVECTTTAGPILINSSRIRRLLSPPQSWTLLSIQKRSPNEIGLMKPNIKLPTNIGSFQLNKPRNVKIEFQLPYANKLFIKSLLTVSCLEMSESNKAPCTLQMVNLVLPTDLDDPKYTWNELGAHQKNKLIIDISKSSFKEGKAEKTGVCVFQLTVSVRVADCAETKHGSKIHLKINTQGEGNNAEELLYIEVDRHGNEKVDLSVKFKANSTDVYAGDTIQLETRIAQSDKSQLECKKLQLRLHHGAWVRHVSHPSRNESIFIAEMSGERMTKLTTRSMYFCDNWTLITTVQFKDPFDFPFDVKLRIYSFTLEVACLTYDHVKWEETPVFFGITNVILHRARDHYTELTTLNKNGFRRCQITWSLLKQLKYRKQLGGCLRTSGLPTEIYNEQPITILMGTLTLMYYVRFNFTAPGHQSFSGKIFSTTDARNYMFVQEETFYTQSDNVYSCVFRAPILARGLRIIPIKLKGPGKIPVTGMQLYGQVQDTDHERFDPCLPQYTAKIKWPSTVPESLRIRDRSFLHADQYFIICHPVLDVHGLQMPRMKCNRAVDEHGLRWLDLGPFVSQVITYQSEDKFLFGVAPQEESLMMSKDFGRTWVGINLYGYQHYGLSKTHTNATYFPWESTDNFNLNLIGKACTAYASGPWNVCYSGVYYNNVRKAVWDNDCPTNSN